MRDRDINSYRAEAEGRREYGEALKAQLINQHVELCKLTEKYDKLKQASDAAYVLVEKHTPYGRHVPLRNVINWLIESRELYRTYSDRDQRELRLLKDDRHRAIGLLMDHDIYSGGLAQGIKELLARTERRRSWRTLLRRAS